MLRGDGVLCGTSTVSTGTLTLAATPAPPGGVDFDVWARSLGFGNSAAILVDYTIIEYTSSTFGTAKSEEGGIGTLTLGGSSGIANCTLARTTVDYTITSLDSQPAAYNQSPGAGISIATAANALVMVSPRVRSLLGALSYSGASSTTLSRDGAGIGVPQLGTAGASGNVANQTIYYVPIFVPIRIGVTKARARVGAGNYTGQNNNLYAALYAVGTDGLPGKLLADFGVLGTANASFATTNTIIASAALGATLYLEPGFYIGAIHPIWTTGGTGTPSLTNSNGGTLFSAQMWGSVNFGPVAYLTKASDTNTAFVDPAAAPAAASTSGNTPLMALGT